MYKEFYQLAIKEHQAFTRMSVICLVTLTGTVLEGLNIGLLIPLLENLASPGQEVDHWLSKSIAVIFNTFGVPFSLPTILLGLGVLIITTSLLKYLRLILVEKTQTNFSAWLRTQSMRIWLDADTEYFDKERVGTLIDIAGGQSGRAGSSLYHISEIIASSGVLLVYCISIFLIAPALAAVAFTAGLIITLSTQTYISRTRIVAATLVQQEHDFVSSGIENLSGIRVIKSFLLEPVRLDIFNTHTQAVRNTSFMIGKIRSQLSVAQEIALFLVIGIIVYLGVEVMGVQIAVIVALLFILYRSMPRISSINTLRQNLVTSFAALHSVKQSMDNAAARKVINGSIGFNSLNRNIEFKKVDFSYDGSGQVLHATSFVIEKGKMTAIAGSSGAGKSTIIDLILRFYDPVSGSIQVDGIDLKELDLKTWRKTIGVVSQDIFLFNDSVSYNIGLGDPNITMDQIQEVSRRSYAHEFIQQLPDGYETRIGERGWNLSGGQRQRLALARAILRNPEILILDEATSSLDSESEQLIQRYINEIRGTCTMVVVAHRLSTIQSADKILVLQSGQIVEEGTWDHLLAKGGVFTNYHNLQSGVIGNHSILDRPTFGSEDPQVGTVPAPEPVDKSNS